MHMKEKGIYCNDMAIEGSASALARGQQGLGLAGKTREEDERQERRRRVDTETRRGREGVAQINKRGEGFSMGAICYFTIISTIYYALRWLLSFIFLGFVAVGFYFIFYTIPLLLYGRKKGIRTGALSGLFIATIPIVSLLLPSPLLFLLKVKKYTQAKSPP